MHRSQQGPARNYPAVAGVIKARRAGGSPSFRNTGFASYVVKRPGERMVTVTANLGPGCTHSFKHILMFDSNGSRIGAFEARMGADLSWTLDHRWIDPRYRGYNLGKVGIRLAEQAVLMEGGTEMVLGTEQKHVLITALSLGYEVEKNWVVQDMVKGIIGLGPSKPLPPRKTLIAKLKSDKIREKIERITLVRKLVSRGT